MKLDQYLAKNSLTVAAFAASIGVHFGTVHRWISGDRVPSMANLAKITKATRGQVKPETFYRE